MSDNIFVKKSKENGRVSPAVIWGEAFQIGDIFSLEMPVVHSSKDVELRTGNTGWRFIEVWSGVLKTVKLDEITLGISINEGEKFL